MSQYHTSAIIFPLPCTYFIALYWVNAILFMIYNVLREKINKVIQSIMTICYVICALYILCFHSQCVYLAERPALNDKLGMTASHSAQMNHSPPAKTEANSAREKYIWCENMPWLEINRSLTVQVLFWSEMLFTELLKSYSYSKMCCCLISWLSLCNDLHAQ